MAFATKQPSTFAADRKIEKLRVAFSKIKNCGSQMKKIRLQKKLWQTDMVKLLYVAVTTYRQWENEKAQPSYAEWKRVMEFCGLTNCRSGQSRV